MRHFLSRFALFAALQAAVAAVLWWHYPVPHDPVFAAVRGKQARLQRLSPPRLILVGGSNVGMSVDSERLERELGMSVVNMGMSVGLHLPLMAAQIKPHLAPGDVVVVMPEYELFTHYVDALALFQLLEQVPEQWHYLTASDWRHLFDNGQIYLAQVSRMSLAHWLGRPFHPLPEPYTGRAYNAWGDATAHLDLPQAAPPLASQWDRWQPVAVPEAVAVLASLAAAAQARHARVMVAYPPFPVPLGTARAHDLQQLDVRLRALLPEVTFLCVPADQWLPPDLFYDSPYHLRRVGRDLRTTRLLDELRAAHAGPAGLPAAVPSSTAFGP